MQNLEDFTTMLKHSIELHFDGAYWTEAENRLIYINDAGCRALGYERSELMGRTASDINPLATPERLRKVWEVLRNKGVYSTGISESRRGRDRPRLTKASPPAARTLRTHSEPSPSIETR